MDILCDQHIEDDHILLDDENTSFERYNNYVENTSQWVNSTQNHNWITSDFNNISTTSRHDPNIISDMDDHLEILENSPLLINDCYQHGDEFQCHNSSVSNEDKRAWKKLLLASILCFLFMLTELIGGYIADSLAIMTDAAHLFSDFVGFLISLLSIWIARKSPTRTMTFGYYRAEVLGAFLSVLTVWLLAGVFAVLAINRLWRKDYEIDADTMMLVASLGLVVNIVMGTLLYGFCHNHTHGSNETTQGNHHSSNINIRAAAAHVLGDLLQSFGVFIAAIIIKLFPDAKLADPICTLIFSVIVICTTGKVAKDAIWLLLEGSPKDSADLAVDLKCISHVKQIHNLHIWTLSPGKNVVSVHLCVDKYCDKDVILKEANSIIKSKLNVISCTVQIETYSPEAINSCKCHSVQC